MTIKARIFPIILAVTLFAASNVFAQPFEGTIYMEISSSKTSKMDSVLGVKPGDSKTLMDISFKNEKFVVHSKWSSGKMDVYGDESSHRVIIRMNEADKAMELPLKKPNYISKANRDDPTTVIATGQKKTISGHDCELYTIKSDKSGESDWWMSHDLPKILSEAVKGAFDQSGGSAKTPSRNNYYGSDAVEALFDKGLLPLRMETKRDGKTESTITFVKYEEKKIDDVFLIIPSKVEVVSMGGK